MKYRIIRKEIGTGEVYYIPQRRIFGIWFSFRELFNTRNKAIDFIENHKKSKKIKKTLVYRDED